MITPVFPCSIVVLLQVRLAFLDLVGNWLLALPERSDHQARLLPYLLNGLCDESPATVEASGVRMLHDSL